MKTDNFLHKTVMLKFLLAGFLLFGLSGFTHVYAQCIVPPIFADKMVSAGPGGYPNSSTIDYTPFCTVGCATTNSQLTAVVSGGPIPVPMLFVSDQVFPGIGWVPTPIPTPPSTVPDVAIGNDIFTPGDYIAAVAFTMANDVFITTYDVTNVGTPGLSVALAAAPFNISLTGNVVGPVHIDMIAQYSTLFFGLPLVNTFVVTWQDQALGIMAYSASLNAPAAGVTWVVDPNLNCSSPDVAGVERFNPILGAFENWALFSYVDQMTITPLGILYENESIIGGPAVGPTVYDNTHSYINVSPFLSVARIDAIDDFNQNAPGPAIYPFTPAAKHAYFDIVAAAQNPPAPGINILEYNNLTGPLVATDITSPLACIAGAQNLVPVVACGPGSIYTVGYFSQGPTQDYYTRAVNWTTGVPPGPPALEYQIPMKPWAGSPGIPWGVALSGTSNTDALGTQNLFTTWENNGFLWDKYTILPYAFKEPSTTAVAALIPSGEWQLYPNPANDNITLVAPTGFSLNEGSTYRITDMAGRTLMQNPISNANEEININNLSTGMYLINIHAGEASTKTIKFVKE